MMSGRIEVIGLGAGDIEQLPLGIYRNLKHYKGKIYTRTLDHPVIRELGNDGIAFESFDLLYEQSDDFKTVYTNITTTLLAAAQDAHIIYAVPGHPMLAEKTVQLLLEQKDVPIDIIGGQSYLDALFTSLQIDPIDGFQFIDATAFHREQLNYQHHIVFCQVYDAFVASEVKLTLLEDLPADYEIVLVEAAGTKQEKIMHLPLEELDRTMDISNLTSVYIPPVPRNYLNHEFHALRDVIRTLRGENGCPWDKKQTHESLRQYAVEEVYELIAAINEEDDEAIIEELGDVLLQVMLHSQIGEDNGYFTIDDVIRKIHNKMIHRHPHVFGGGDETKTWEQLKQEEKPKEENDLLLDSVVTSGPSLQVAYQLQKKVAKVGFEWDHVEAIWEKFKEEKAEFKEALEQEDEKAMEDEFGDMLFVLANIAKYYDINPEIALTQANGKFVSRFNEVERQAHASGNDLSSLTFHELDAFWDIAKRKERE